MSLSKVNVKYAAVVGGAAALAASYAVYSYLLTKPPARTSDGKLDMKKEVAASSKPIYLDWNASTPVYPEVKDAIIPFITDCWGNPSSGHWAGKIPKDAMQEARQNVKQCLNATDHKVIFTGSGTESNNLAIRGAINALKTNSKPHVVTSNLEHPAVLLLVKEMESQGMIEVTYLNDPVVTVESVLNAINDQTALISLMWANNEVGTVTDIPSIVQKVKAQRPDIIFHSDAAQAIGKIDVDLNAVDLDLLTIVGHKIGAPKGVAALITKDVKIKPLVYGGGQEQGIRSGTENVPYCVGLGKAMRIHFEEAKSFRTNMRELRDRLLQELEVGLPPNSFFVNGRGGYGMLPNTLHISLADHLDARRVLNVGNILACSAGSACHTGSAQAGVMGVLGIKPGFNGGNLRLSVGRSTTIQEVKSAAKIVIEALKR